MLYRSFYPRDLFAEFDRLQRELQASLDTVTPSIRGVARGYPALNVGSTPTTVEVYAFAPGMDPQAIEVNLERGVLTIEGRRPATVKAEEGKPGASRATGSTTHIAERFDGHFRRVLSLPEDIDPAAVTADYRDGVLHVSIGRRAAAQPRRIDVH